MAEFEVSGIAYKSRRMTAMTEERVTRKLAPLLNIAVPALAAMKDGGGRIDIAKVDTGKMVETLTRTIATLPDENAQDIIASCLDVCERQQGDKWVKVWSAGGKRPFFDDIRAPQMYLIAAKVMEDAFRDFLSALGPSLAAGGLSTDTSPSSSEMASTT